jgi:hypothetical protein
MRNLEKLGKISSECEVTTVTQFGVWVLAHGKEYFLDHKDYPWFREEAVEDVLDVKSLGPDHLHWPKLDIDLHIDSLQNPERYPLVAKAKRAKTTKRKSGH